MGVAEKTIGVVVFTLNAEKHLLHCLTPFLESPLKPKILVVDSSSTDNTLLMAEQLNVDVLSISRSEFNHGKTRELARKHLNTEIVVMLTQDAYAMNGSVLEKLIQPLIEGNASLSYARQIPHEGADFFESFPRFYNYPSISEVRSVADRQRYGAYTYFCSDSCAAYSNNALDEIGGFRTVLLGEDTLAAADLLKSGHKIAYVAEAQVRHSHRYGLAEEFRRYFDTGLMRKEYENILNCEIGDQSRGKDFAFTMLKEVYRHRISLVPYAILHVLCKWVGYRLGQASLHAPIWWKKFLSSQKYYWIAK